MTADVADREVELIAFDYFRLNPHYHHIPRNITSESSLMRYHPRDDSMEWVLDEFKGGKLPAMIERVGYPTVAAALYADLVATKVSELETTNKTMVKKADQI